jgi:hypothetical protein
VASEIELEGWQGPAQLASGLAQAEGIQKQHASFWMLLAGATVASSEQ